MVVLLFLCTTLAFAIKVDENELETADANKSLTFESFTSTGSWVNSLKGIKNIGVQLGWPVAAERPKQQTVGNKNRYAVIHAIDPEEKTGFDADIIVFGTGAAVDHINNVRHIIASYLTAAYNYSDQDAFTIAILVTVYNGIYRGDIEFFSKKYKTIVMTNLEKDKCGLALSYKDWPGKTQIVIPLSDGTQATLNTVDLATITDKKVIAAVVQDKSINIPVTSANNESGDSPKTINIKDRVESLKRRAKVQEIELGLNKTDSKLALRILLFVISAVLLVAGLVLLFCDIAIHKKIDDISDKELLLSSTETSSYISHFALKKLVIIIACALNTIAFVMTLLALCALAFVPPATPFIVAVSIMLAVGVAGISILIKLVLDLRKRCSAVGMAKLNPPGVNIDTEPTVIGDPVIVTTSSNDPLLKGGDGV